MDEDQTDEEILSQMEWNNEFELVAFIRDPFSDFNSMVVTYGSDPENSGGRRVYLDCPHGETHVSTFVEDVKVRELGEALIKFADEKNFP